MDLKTTDLNSLVIFARVAESKSFSEAARQLRMPVSTVSRRVADLENRLGVRLLERSSRNLRLTELGRAVQEHAVQTAELGETIDRMISSRLTDVCGVLRISAPSSLSETLILPLVGAFMSFHPDVRVELSIARPGFAAAGHKTDLTFIVGPCDDPSLVPRRIGTSRSLLVASPAYLARSLPALRPDDLRQHRLLSHSSKGPGNSWTFVPTVEGNGTGPHELAFEPFLMVDDFVSLAHALLCGLGIGEFAPVVQPKLLTDGLLVEVMPDWEFEPTDLSIAHFANNHIPWPARLFEEYTVENTPGILRQLPA